MTFVISKSYLILIVLRISYIKRLCYELVRMLCVFGLCNIKVSVFVLVYNFISILKIKFGRLPLISYIPTSFKNPLSVESLAFFKSETE